MSQLGLGAMLFILSGGGKYSAAEFVGRKIIEANISNEDLKLTFADGVTIRIFDAGQSCCEARYMTCDDDVQSLVGHTLTRIDAKEGPTISEDWQEHETCFVEVGTDAGFITITNHNEHNGYYGGFGLDIEVVSSTTTKDSPHD